MVYMTMAEVQHYASRGKPSFGKSSVSELNITDEDIEKYAIRFDFGNSRSTKRSVNFNFTNEDFPKYAMPIFPRKKSVKDSDLEKDLE